MQLVMGVLFMKQRIKGVLLIAVLLLVLSACGKEKDADDKKKDNSVPTKAPTTEVTQAPTQTPTGEVTGPVDPTPTEDPGFDDEGSVFERIAEAFNKTFADGNVTVKYTSNWIEDGETTTYIEKDKLVKQEDGYLLFSDIKFEDDSKVQQFAFVREDGGVFAESWWDNKLMFDIMPIDISDAKYMYPCVEALTDPDKSFIEAFIRLIGAEIPGWPENLNVSGKTLLTLLKPYDNEQYLTEKLGYSRSEDGKDCFKIKAEVIQGLGASLKDQLSSLSKYFQYLDTIDSVGQGSGTMEIQVGYEDGRMSFLGIRYVTAEGIGREFILEASDYGTSSIYVPDKMQAEFEEMKQTYSKREGGRAKIAHAYAYISDVNNGNIDKDNKMLLELYGLLTQALMDEELNKEVYAAINGDYIEITYLEGERFDKTGIPGIDAILKEHYGDQTFRVVSESIKPALLWIDFYRDNGTAKVYLDVDVNIE